MRPIVPVHYETVPRLWPHSTIVCLGSGPSLTREDVAACRGQHVIAINETYTLAPWADVLYSSDLGWWNRHRALPWAGLKFGVEQEPGSGRRGFKPNDFGLLKNAGDAGLSMASDALATIRNSGGAAINLAVHLGATRILLLGYDMQRGPKGESHWYVTDPRWTHPYQMFRQVFPTMLAPLQKAGVTVINCSRVTALTCFQKQPLAEVLPREVAA